MKWLKRSFWTAAWGAWLWLGFGLHRELPRDLRKTSGELGLRGAERPLGFAGGDDLVLTETSLRNDQSRFVIWEVAGPRQRISCVTPLGWRTTRVAPSHAVAFGGPTDGVFRAMSVVEVLDLETGGRRRLADEAEVVGVHPTRPWVALALKGPKDVVEGRSFPRSSLQVVDFRTGSPVLDWSDSQTNANGPRILDCQFDGDDGIYVLADHYFGNEPDPGCWEVVRLSLKSGETSRMALGRTRSRLVPPVSGGRVVQFGISGGETFSEVFEFPSGRRVFSSAGRTPETPWRNEWRSSPRLSPDGRSLYTGIGTLWSIDGDSRRLWPRSPEEPLGGWSMSSLFSVNEDWNDWLDRFFGPEGFATVAVRNFSDGSLRCRLRDGVNIACFSEDGRRGIASDGAVYTLPPPANWPLLALCQAVLAMPLILFWVILRWRRNRRLRLAGVQP